MTEKRFRVNDLVKYNYSEIGEYIDENHTDKPLRNDEIVDLLNCLNEENKQLKKDIEYYKTERLALFEYLDKKDDLKLELKVEK